MRRMIDFEVGATGQFDREDQKRTKIAESFEYCVELFGGHCVALKARKILLQAR